MNSFSKPSSCCSSTFNLASSSFSKSSSCCSSTFNLTVARNRWNTRSCEKIIDILIVAVRRLCTRRKVKHLLGNPSPIRPVRLRLSPCLFSWWILSGNLLRAALVPLIYLSLRFTKDKDSTNSRYYNNLSSSDVTSSSLAKAEKGDRCLFFGLLGSSSHCEGRSSHWDNKFLIISSRSLIP